MSVFISAVLLCTASWANGGPEAWTEVTPLGSAAPRETTDVRLRSEELNILLNDDLQHYQVRAEYHLVVPGPRHVRFAVPLTWVSQPEGGAAAPAVRINDAPFLCQVEPAASAKEPLDEMSVPPPIQAWCAGWLDLAPGDDVVVALAYTGELLYTDWSTNKSALFSFGERTLYYPLFPADAWQGTPDRVDVAINVGAWAPFLKDYLPADGQHTGASLNWSWDRPDLTEKGRIQVNFDAAVLLQARQVQTWNRSAPTDLRLALTASASSTLAAQADRSYAASNVTDGDPSTAWCEGVAGKGVGQWVELKMDGKMSFTGGQQMPVLEQITMVPGYARSESTWSGNGRVQKVRVSACGSSSGGQVVDLAPLPTNPALAASAVLYGVSDSGDAGQAALQAAMASEPCLRFTIEAVEPGEKWRDTCISEIVPILNWN